MFLLNRGITESQEQFIVEHVSDIQKLPTSTKEGDKSLSFGQAYNIVGFGSIAWCIENGKFYVLATDDEWHIVGSTCSNSGDVNSGADNG